MPFTQQDKPNLGPGISIITEEGQLGVLVGPKMDDNFWTVKIDGQLGPEDSYTPAPPETYEVIHINQMTYWG